MRSPSGGPRGRQARRQPARIGRARVREGFPGIAKTDERDARVIARSAHSMPQTLRPVPADDPGHDEARITAAQLSQVQKNRTACASALRSRLLESYPAFEVACCMRGNARRARRTLEHAETGREAFRAASRRHGATREQRERLWNAISGEQPSEQGVAAEMRHTRRFARRIASDNGRPSSRRPWPKSSRTTPTSRTFRPSPTSAREPPLR
ncbi:IS110 family transposase [Gordonibacter urolithinfaciens]|uniref:IS110 family transposase n=1 Tax=Gordonibacter urolithinfaciens TaxID=1335613 RepID=UPI001CD2E038